MCTCIVFFKSWVEFREKSRKKLNLFANPSRSPDWSSVENPTAVDVLGFYALISGISRESIVGFTSLPLLFPAEESDVGSVGTAVSCYAFSALRNVNYSRCRRGRAPSRSVGSRKFDLGSVLSWLVLLYSYGRCWPNTRHWKRRWIRFVLLCPRKSRIR